MVLETGLLSPAYSAGKDLLKLILKSRSDKNVDIVKYRDKKRIEFEENLKWIDDTVGFGEAIISDVKRIDIYPETIDQKKGISPWFRVGLKGLYSRGVKVGLGIHGIVYDENVSGWRFNNYIAGEESDKNAVLIGLIPFERIISVNWDGDEYYSIPHISCHFTGKRKEPYERIVLSEKRKLDNHVYYTEIINFESVVKLSKKMKTGYFA